MKRVPDYGLPKGGNRSEAEYETNQAEAVEQVNGRLYGNQKLETSAVSR